jgi:hypothetical protein
MCRQVYLGEQYVNNATLSDVTFLVDGRRFHAHRIALLASSDTFRVRQPAPPVHAAPFQDRTSLCILLWWQGTGAPALRVLS